METRHIFSVTLTPPRNVPELDLWKRAFRQLNGYSVRLHAHKIAIRHGEGWDY